MLSSSYTGVDFINKIEANVSNKANVFDFDYFYNGAGVATVDINNDGLLDLFFTANQTMNKLYLNVGNLQFKDITEGAGINTGKGWSTGVSFADVNDDGWQDIYVSQGGPYVGEKSKNLLFINQKNQTFNEEADLYGLADKSISSQSVFFDFDKDGDLDCFVMNENELYGTHPNVFYSLTKNDDELLYRCSSHFYRNDNGHFTDISRACGVLKPSFGLGLIVSDINNDSWLDIYVANDYYVPDMMFINKSDGTFSNMIDEYTNQVSFFGMGVDIADINADNYNDIFVLDMASTDHYRAKTLMASMNVDAFKLLTEELNLQHQYMFNSLQLNSGDSFFKNISQLTKMAKSDWSWAVLLNDFDNNSTTDVFITNGYRKYALDNDTQTQVLDARKKYGNNVPLEIKRDLYEKMPSEKLSNLFFKNNDNLKFEEVSESWGLSKPSYSNGAAYADLDNDGDLDLVINNIDDEAFIYQNTTTENNAGNYLQIKFDGSVHSFTKVTIQSSGKTQTKESNAVRGYLSAMDPSIHFGLGSADKIDVLKIEWLSGATQLLYNLNANQSIVIKETDAEVDLKDEPFNYNPFEFISNTSLNVNFTHRENNYDDFEVETLLPYRQSNLGPSITVGDINGDELDDLFIGSSIGQSPQLYVQTTNGDFADATSDALKFDFLFEDMEAAFLDIDNDGDHDLYVATGGYEFEIENGNFQDRLYVNNGFGGYLKAIDSTLLRTKLSGKSVAILDYNNDGLDDIIVGTRIIPGKYPMSDRSILYRNTGRNLVDVTAEVIPDLLTFGMINKILATDFDLDGLIDLLVLGEWTGVGLFRNTGVGFQDISSTVGLNQLKGWWFNVAELDINNDGLPDYLLGNLGLNSKYAASHEKPLKIFAKDFDDNGSWDVVLSNAYKDNYVPLRGRECSSNQMPFIADNFPTYDLFAKATIEDVYGDKLNSAYSREVNEFRSMLLVNKGDGNFEISPLPMEAQIAPILDSEVLDLNGDGFDDVVMIGTIYDTEVETPRLDMGSGTILLSNGNDKLTYDTELNRGLRLKGDLKSIEKIQIAGVDHLVVGRNNDSPLFLKVHPMRKSK